MLSEQNKSRHASKLFSIAKYEKYIGKSTILGGKTRFAYMKNIRENPNPVGFIPNQYQGPRAS